MHFANESANNSPNHSAKFQDLQFKINFEYILAMIFKFIANIFVFSRILFYLLY